MNPVACAAKARAILDQGGLHYYRIATVTGDDLMPRLDALLAAGHELANLDTGEPLETVRGRVVSVNAYLGARPVAEALGAGTSLVITGRVADASLSVGPAVHGLRLGLGRLGSPGSGVGSRTHHRVRRPGHGRAVV